MYLCAVLHTAHILIIEGTDVTLHRFGWHVSSLETPVLEESSGASVHYLVSQ